MSAEDFNESLEKTWQNLSRRLSFASRDNLHRVDETSRLFRESLREKIAAVPTPPVDSLASRIGGPNRVPRPSGATLDLATDDDDDDGEDDVEGTLPHAIIRSPPVE